jgi:hypothetical protein
MDKTHLWKCEQCHKTVCIKGHNLRGEHLDLSCNVQAERLTKWVRQDDEDFDPQKHSDQEDIAIVMKDKQPELMTLQEAHKKANIGDKITFHGRLAYVKREKNESVVILETQANEEEWQVIPAEPVVLSADEWEKSYYAIDQSEPLYDSNDLKNGFDAGDKNGQRRRDKEYKEPMKAFIELLEKAKRYMENHNCNDFTAYIEQSEKTLKNIKPLEKEMLINT